MEDYFILQLLFKIIFWGVLAPCVYLYVFKVWQFNCNVSRGSFILIYLQLSRFPASGYLSLFTKVADFSASISDKLSAFDCRLWRCITAYWPARFCLLFINLSSLFSFLVFFSFCRIPLHCLCVCWSRLSHELVFRWPLLLSFSV